MKKPKLARQRAYPLLPPGPEHITLTVQQSCVAELEGAVDLLLRFENNAAAHLLSAAANELLRKRAKKIGITVESDMRERIKGLDDSTRQHIIYAMEYAYNGLKHSNGDREINVYFRPKFVEYHLMLSIDMYQVVFKDITPKMNVFKTWAMFRMAKDHPEIQSYIDSIGVISPNFPISRRDVCDFLKIMDEKEA